MYHSKHAKGAHPPVGRVRQVAADCYSALGAGRSKEANGTKVRAGVCGAQAESRIASGRLAGYGAEDFMSAFLES